MAEGFFRKAMARRKEGQIVYEVGSAGVAANPGAPASQETLSILTKRVAPLDRFHSRMVNEEMLREATAVFCMTEGHLELLEAMFPEYEKKYHLACDFLEVDGVVGMDVPDPIGMGAAAYEEVAEVLEAAMEGVTGYLDSREG